MYHEIKWGLPVRGNLPYEERRRMIYAKRDCRAPMTPYRMEKYLEDVTGFEVHIADVHDPGGYGFSPSHPNVFKAFFIGEETLDSKLVHRILDRLKQSHTMYTVNERIETVFDSRKLGQVILKNIRFKIGLPFWYEYVLDGGWFLDGSVMLGQKRRYGLALAVKHGARFRMEWQIRLAPAGIRTGVMTAGSAAAGAWFRSGILFWDGGCLDGSWLLDGSRRLAGGYEAGMAMETYVEMDFFMQESADNLTVETKTRDHWFMDGSFCLDGARDLDSVYRQEVIG